MKEALQEQLHSETEGNLPLPQSQNEVEYMDIPDAVSKWFIEKRKVCLFVLSGRKVKIVHVILKSQTTIRGKNYAKTPDLPHPSG